MRSGLRLLLVSLPCWPLRAATAVVGAKSPHPMFLCTRSQQRGHGRAVLQVLPRKGSSGPETGPSPGSIPGQHQPSPCSASRSPSRALSSTSPRSRGLSRSSTRAPCTPKTLVHTLLDVQQEGAWVQGMPHLLLLRCLCGPATARRGKTPQYSGRLVNSLRLPWPSCRWG